jgi:hypothetical protein
MRQRARTVFAGGVPVRPPLITRIDFWLRHHQHAGTLPEEFRGRSIVEISRAVGIGRQASAFPGSFKFRRLEVRLTHAGKTLYREHEPELNFFPILTELVPNDRPGETLTELITPVGRLGLVHVTNAEMIAAGVTRPILKTHPIQSAEDDRVYAYILEHCEYVLHAESFLKAEAALGEDGYLIPALERIPFQSLLLDVLGETGLFYALHDRPQAVERLLRVLDERTVEKLEALAGLAAPFVEFTDNLDGQMTNPRLFRRHCLPAYQRYAAILHRQGKRMGSHTDGNLQPLAGLLPESGLDVAESFTPAPLTPLRFEDAWRAWQHGPLIWGGIPSYYLEEAYVDGVLDLTRGKPILLGVTDAVMGDNSIERLRRLAAKVNAV